MIPAEARKECDLAPGDKVLVFRHPLHPKMLILTHVTDIQQLHQQMLAAVNNIHQLITSAQATVDEEKSNKEESNA